MNPPGWPVTAFLLPLLAVLVAGAIQRHGYPRFVAQAKRARERWKKWRHARRWRASKLRSVAGFNEDTRAIISIRDIFEEWEAGESGRKREDAQAYGIPYWALRTAQQMGITVSEYRSLPRNEQWAWKLYFELDEETRRHHIEASQEVEHQELLKMMEKSKEQEGE